VLTGRSRIRGMKKTGGGGGSLWGKKLTWGTSGNMDEPIYTLGGGGVPLSLGIFSEWIKKWGYIFPCTVH
jgi:hypothetical protein